ncbi:uncharacterized protein LOC143235865 isoform X2 [Tachypleus tridentatus]|uniref:uncharacterized protein LOC143235865 isoform X2 n=1 Tax=Tachypleus tridentatus TaxID=6853 RepID=UPI003FD0025E
MTSETKATRIQPTEGRQLRQFYCHPTAKRPGRKKAIKYHFLTSKLQEPIQNLKQKSTEKSSIMDYTFLHFLALNT